MKLVVVLAAVFGVAWCRDAITVDPGTSPGNTVDSAAAGLQNVYCESKNKECPGSNLESRFSATLGDCLSRCNRNLQCMTVFYSSTKTCNLRSNRCSSGQLKSADGADYYRLKLGETCPSDRPTYSYNGPYYGNTFCMMWGKACKGHNLYPKPQNIGPYLKCLQKCAKIRTCAGVDFYMEGSKPKCELKEYMCSDDELVDAPDTQNFLRLLADEPNCPSNRGPPAATPPPPTPAPSCPPNASFKNGRCQCNSGFQMQGSQCVEACPPNASYNNGRCQCNSGFQMQGARCVEACPANAEYKDGRCQCRSGYVMQGGRCVQPSCPENASYINGRCQCKSGFLMQGNRCMDNRPCIQRDVSLADSPKQVQLNAGLLFYVRACNKRYQIRSRSEAAQYCAKYGAVLAAPGHINQAFRAGTYWCGCGWVKSGEALFPIVGKARAHGCGKDNQVNKCADRFMGRWGGPGWDAWCILRGHRG